MDRADGDSEGIDANREVKKNTPQESNEDRDAYEFSSLSGGAETQSSVNIDFILDVPLEIAVELGRTRMVINDLLKLGQGSVIELSKEAGETLEILANNRLIARGEVVVVGEKYGIRVTEIRSPIERIERLR